MTLSAGSFSSFSPLFVSYIFVINDRCLPIWSDGLFSSSPTSRSFFGDLNSIAKSCFAVGSPFALWCIFHFASLKFYSFVSFVEMVCTICCTVKTVFGPCKFSHFRVSLWETLFFIIINQCTIPRISTQNGKCTNNFEWMNSTCFSISKSICIDANDRNKSFHLLRAILKPFEIINQAFMMIVIFSSPHLCSYLFRSNSLNGLTHISSGWKPFNHFTKSEKRQWR